MQRVTIYIDGFNLYYGLRDKNWQRYLWLDVRRLSENLLRSGQSLVAVHYFTARVHPDPNDPGKSIRQDTFLDALTTLPDVHIHYGYYLPKKGSCAKCGATWRTYEEKMTDVNIAVELLGDAQDNTFDTAIVMSGDSDLAEPVNAVRKRYPKKRVVVAFPPKRVSKQLKQLATKVFRHRPQKIGRQPVAQSNHQTRRLRLDAAPHLELRKAHGADQNPQETDRSRPATRQNQRRLLPREIHPPRAPQHPAPLVVAQALGNGAGRAGSLS